MKGFSQAATHTFSLYVKAILDFRSTVQLQLSTVNQNITSENSVFKSSPLGWRQIWHDKHDIFYSNRNDNWRLVYAMWQVSIYFAINNHVKSGKKF